MIKKWLKYYFFLLIFIFQVVPANAIKYFSLRDGLPSNTIYKIIQDNSGYIWIATDNGLAKFDGFEFKVFNLNKEFGDNSIINISIDNQNRIWFINTIGTIGMIDKDSVFSNLTNPIIPKTKSIYWKGKAFNNQFVMFDDKFIYTIESNITTRVQIPSGAGRMSDMFLINNQLVFTNGYKLYKINNYKLDTIKSLGKVNSISRINNIEFLRKDNSVIYSNENGSKLIKPDFTIENLKEFQLQTEYNYFAIKNELEIITNNRHYQFKYASEYMYYINYLEKFHIDRSGNIWFSHELNGLGLICKDEIYNRSNSTSIYKASSTIKLFSTLKGLTFLDKNDSLFQIDKNQQVNFIYRLKNTTAFTPINENKWVVANNAALFVITKNGNNYKSEQLLDSVNLAYKGLEIIDNYLFAATHRGLVIVDLDKPKSIRFLFEDRCYNIKRIDKNLYVSTISGLIKVYFNKTEIKSQVLKNIPVQRYISICKYKDGIMLLNSIGTVYWYNLNDNKLFSYTFSEKQQRLSAMDVLKDYCILKHINGISYYSIVSEKNNRIYFRKYFNLGSNSGLISNQVQNLHTSFDTLYYSIENKIFKVTDNTFKKSNWPKEQIVFSLNGQIINGSKKILLKNTQNFINFYVFDPSYQLQRLEYSIPSLGISRNSNNSNKLQLYQLSPGSVELKCVLLNSIGSSLYLNPIKIQISQLWINKWYIRVGISFLLILLLFVFINNRIKRIKLENSKNKMKLASLQAQMNPHFIFNALNSIQLLIQKNENELSGKYIAKLSRLLQSNLQKIEYNLISIDEEIILLTRYLELEKLRFKNKLKYEIIIEEGFKEAGNKIPPMIIQPIVENAIKHGMLDGVDVVLNVKIIFNSLVNGFEITVIDNGIGINQSSNKSKKSIGYENLKERITLLKILIKLHLLLEITDLSETDQSQKGTKVNLKFIWN